MPGPKHRWAVGPSREIEQPDGSVLLRMDVRRDGKVVGVLVLKGSGTTSEFTDLSPWVQPVEAT